MQEGVENVATITTCHPQSSIASQFYHYNGSEFPWTPASTALDQNTYHLPDFRDLSISQGLSSILNHSTSAD